MLSIGFGQSKYDRCVYLHRLNDGLFIYLFLYVDDILIGTNDLYEIDHLKIILNSKFEMKDLGAVKKILGMEISRDRRFEKFFLCHNKITSKGFSSNLRCKIQILLTFDFRVITDRKQRKVHVQSSLLQCNRSLMYAMVCTQPDISHFVSVVSRYMARLDKLHWQAVKWILRYLSGISNIFLEFERISEGLVGYVDSNYARDLSDLQRWSSTSFHLIYFERSSFIAIILFVNENKGKES
ncbi:Retrovirus-related Pol polyprotein from transposon TNT 1-94 [Gossypium australe]|uniref:Retrovirus-related Pol polyprotein from transposon TNT 1-94 n=1 Tax=Gossypium australe TaxID=47621 RepID=A0A5B6WKM5_9ROSI|nr:Retrovirus-related Pol polyprotein from transposon TNT 1-94 [Gossypium australe]